MKNLNGKILEAISGGEYGPNVIPVGVVGVVSSDYWYTRVNANIPVYDNTYVSPNVIYVDQIGFMNPGIQITHVFD